MPPSSNPSRVTVDVLVPHQDEESALAETRQLAAHALGGSVELVVAVVEEEEDGNRTMTAIWRSEKVRP